jgi:hypothetical protein
MVVKIIAIGIKKYLADSMNYLDGFIVISSVFELLSNAFGASVGNNLGTLRVLRTMRVLRMLRLLRTLKSM